MPKTRKIHRKKLRGGDWTLGLGSSTQNTYGDQSQSQGLFSTLTQGASNIWDKTKSTFKSGYDYIVTDNNPSSPYNSSSSSLYSSSSSMMSSPQTTNYQQPVVGGKKHKKKMRGGFHASVGVAAHASPYSGVTAKPQVYVGGKSKNRKHRRSHKKTHRRR